MTIRILLMTLLAAAAIGAPASAPRAQERVTVETQLGDILERPLFARTRRPGGGPAPEAPAAPAAPTETPEAEVATASDAPAQVMGVLIAPPVRKVLLRFGEAPAEWFDEGASAEGWRVSRIEQAAVVLTGAGGDLRLDLHEPAR